MADPGADGGNDLAGGPVVSCGDAAGLPDAADGQLDGVAQRIPLDVVRAGHRARRSAGDDRGGVALGEKATELVGVVALLADAFVIWRDSRNPCGGGGDVGDVAFGRWDCVRSALLVAEHTGLAGAAAARAPQRFHAS